MTLYARQRSLSDYAVIDAHAIMQIVVVFATLTAVVCSGYLSRIWQILKSTPSGIVILYYLFGALSASWSPQPAFSLYRSLEVLSQVAAVHLAIALSRDFPSAECKALFITLITLLIGMAAVPLTFGWQRNLTYWHTNQYTVPALLAFTYACGELFSGAQRNRRLLCFAAICGAIGLLVGTSTASFICMLVGLGTACLLSRQRGRMFVMLSFAGLLLFATVGIPAVEKLVFYGKTEQNVSQWNGRKYIWKGYIADYVQKPLLGHGFAVYARISTHFRTTNTHNAGLSVLLGTGLAGMALVLIALKRLLARIWQLRATTPPGSVGASAALLAGLLNSMSVAFLGEGWMMSSLPFFCMLALFSIYLSNQHAGVHERPRLVIRPVRRALA